MYVRGLLDALVHDRPASARVARGTPAVPAGWWELEAAVSISEDEGKAAGAGPSPADFDLDGDDGARQPSPGAKWGTAGLMLAYAGLGSYCVAAALGHVTGAAHPEGASPAVARAPGKAA